MNIILYLYVTIIMLIKNISTDWFEVELLLFKDDLTVESYKHYEERNGVINKTTYVNYRTGIECFEIDLRICYRINSENNLVLNERDVNENENTISNMTITRRNNLLSKLKAVDLNERGIIKKKQYDLSRQNNVVKSGYHKYNLYPYYNESIEDYWTRAKELLLSCITRNPSFTNIDKRVYDICNMSNFAWYYNLKSFKPKVNETMESYYMRMTKYDRRPLVESLLKKFYFDIFSIRAPGNSTKNPKNFHESFQENFLQCITLCNRPLSDEDQNSNLPSQYCTLPEKAQDFLSQHKRSKKYKIYDSTLQSSFNDGISSINDTVPKFNEGFSYQSNNNNADNANQYFQYLLNNSHDLQGAPDIMYKKEDTAPNLNEESRYQNDNIYDEHTYQYLLNNSHEHWNHLQGVPNIMYKKDDTTQHLDVDVGSSYQHENIPYTTVTMDEDPSSQYRYPNPDYISQNILDITREHHKGADIMYSTNDTTPHLELGSSYQHENIPYTTATMYENSSSQYPPPYVNYRSQNILDITREQHKGANTMHNDPYNLIGSSSHQYQNFNVENTKQNNIGTSSQHWNHPGETANIMNNMDDDTFRTYNFDKYSNNQQQTFDVNNSFQNNTNDIINEEVDLDEITKIMSSIDYIIPDNEE